MSDVTTEPKKEEFVFDLPCEVVYEGRTFSISIDIAKDEMLLRKGLGTFIPNISQAAITYTREEKRIRIDVAKYTGKLG